MLLSRKTKLKGHKNWVERHIKGYIHPDAIEVKPGLREAGKTRKD